MTVWCERGWGLINSLRFTLKSLGYTISQFHRRKRFHKVSIASALPESVVPSDRSEQSKRFSKRNFHLVESSYSTREDAQLRLTSSIPETSWLGADPRSRVTITALYSVFEDWRIRPRFERVRDVGAFIGLCPRRDQSGENDPELRISKRGDAYVRRLLVSSAQYILGPFAPPSALRQYGLALAAGATARAKKRAVAASWFAASPSMRRYSSSGFGFILECGRSGSCFHADSGIYSVQI